jgi:ribonuclease HI
MPALPPPPNPSPNPLPAPAELEAIKEAMRINAKVPIVIFTDSKVAIKAIEKRPVVEKDWRMRMQP